jgi:hypothetical protein
MVALLAGAPYPRHLHRRGAVPHEQLAGARSARPQLEARATVQATHEIDTLTRGPSRLSPMRAAQPYTIVELSFVPTGMAGPVVAVDMVDAGSVAGLKPGA